MMAGEGTRSTLDRWETVHREGVRCGMVRLWIGLECYTVNLVVCKLYDRPHISVPVFGLCSTQDAMILSELFQLTSLRRQL